MALAVMKEVDSRYNMGSGQVYRIGDIVEALTEIAEISSRLEWDPTKPNGQAYRAYDLSKILDLVKPAYSIRETGSIVGLVLCAA